VLAELPLGVQASLQVDQGGNRPPQDLAGDAFFVDVQLLEERLVEEPATVVGGAAVKLLEVAEEVEGGVQEDNASAEVVVRLGELGLDLGAPLVDPMEAVADLGLGS